MKDHIKLQLVGFVSCNFAPGLPQRCKRIATDCNGLQRIVQLWLRYAVKLQLTGSGTLGFEIALMIKLDHPNVLRLFETFEDEFNQQLPGS